MDYRKIASDFAVAAGVDPGIFTRLIESESAFNPTASNNQAYGIAQIKSATGANPGYGVKPIYDTSDPIESLRFSSEYLRALEIKNSGDIAMALKDYGSTPTAITKILEPYFLEFKNAGKSFISGLTNPFGILTEDDQKKITPDVDLNKSIFTYTLQDFKTILIKYGSSILLASFGLIILVLVVFTFYFKR